MTVNTEFKESSKAYSTFLRDQELNASGVSFFLSNQKNILSYLDQLLFTALFLTKSDGATLYINRGKKLEIFTMFNRSLNMQIRSKLFHKIKRVIPIYQNDNKTPNMNYHAVRAFIKNEPVLTQDIHREPGYDKSGTASFDRLFNYRTKSLLSVPISQNGSVLGVLQVINRVEGDELLSFSELDRYYLEALCKLSSFKVSLIKNLYRYIVIGVIAAVLLLAVAAIFVWTQL